MGRKTSFLKKVCAVFLTAVLAVVPLSRADSSSVEGLQSQIDAKRKENEQRKQLIDKYKSEMSDNDKLIELINEQIDSINDEITKSGQLIIAKQAEIDAKKAEIETAEKSIGDKEIEIENKNSEISELQERNEENLKRFGELARAMYMNDVSDTVPILSGSDDWYDYFVYSDVIKNISEQSLGFMKRLTASIKSCEQMINDLESEKQQLEQDKQSLQQQKEKLDSEMSELKDERKRLDDYAAEQKNYLYSLVADNNELKNKVDGLNYDIDKTNKEIEEYDRQLQEEIRKLQQSGQGSTEDHSSDFRWPLDPEFHRLTTYFGWDTAFGGRNHGGIDIVGTDVSVSSRNIYAVQSGKVIKVYTGCPHDYGKNYSCGCGGGFGNYVIIDHGGGISTLYAHCRKIYVSVGQTVSKSDVIAIVGTTGWSQGEHLHFEVRENGVRVDPLKYTYHDVY